MGLKNRFELGEIDWWNWGQYDQEAYHLGVAWLENFQILPQGGINRRTGYERLTGLELTGVVRLAHIVANDQDYIIALDRVKFVVYDCVTGVVRNGAYGSAHPLDDTGMVELRYCTRKNVAAFVCGQCPPFCITLDGNGYGVYRVMEISKLVETIETKPEVWKDIPNQHINYDKALFGILSVAARVWSPCIPG